MKISGLNNLIVFAGKLAEQFGLPDVKGLMKIQSRRDQL